MSAAFCITRTRVAIVAASVVAIVTGLIGWQVYQKTSTRSVTAYFADVVALYPGDPVLIAGVPVGTVDSIVPDGENTRVTMHYDSQYSVPQDAIAAMLNPSLVSSRAIQLVPAYINGPALDDGAVIPVDRTRVPVEWDDLRDQLARLATDLGPTPAQPMGPGGQALQSFADGLSGKGDEINKAFMSMSDAMTALGEGRSDMFAVLNSLAKFVTALRGDDQRLVALNADLAQFTESLSNSDHDLADAAVEVDELLSTAKGFIDDTKDPLVADINQLAETTTAIVQPDSLNGLETALHVTPNMGANLINIYEPAHGSLSAVPAINNFANPLQFLCSAIQSASRLGFQESAELCAEYLAPILEAIKFNYPPFGLNLFTTADLLPSQVSHSEARLQPPPGFKDTTVPGVFAPDTPFSRGNHEPGWIVAPGMEGLQVQPATATMLSPSSLAELMGSPTPAPVSAESSGAPAPPTPGAPLPAEDPGAPLPADVQGAP